MPIFRSAHPGSSAEAQSARHPLVACKYGAGCRADGARQTTPVCGRRKDVGTHIPPAITRSNTRVAASLVDLCGSEALERLPGRWVFFERDFTELFGDWQRWRGMRVSNLGFARHLTSGHQATLKLSATCGTPDTRKRRK